MASVGNTLCLVAALLLIYQKTATCGAAASTVQPKTSPQDNNTSIFNVCHWVNCGGGFCNKTSLFQYKCNCREGYSNFLNITMFPCIKQHCALGRDCSNHGIPSSNASSSSPPPPPHNSENHGTPSSNASSSSPPPPPDSSKNLPDSSKNLTDSSKNQAAGLNLRGSSLWLIASLLFVSLAPWCLLYI